MGINVADLRFLLIDDEEFIRNLASRILTNLGATSIEQAAHGAQGVERLLQAEEIFDIVICDLNMPEMDGVQFVRHLAEMKFTGGIVFVSGENESLLRAASELAGAYKLNFLGALAKPLRPDPLKALLETYAPQVQAQPGSGDAAGAITDDEARTGLASGCLVPFFQPKVSMEDRRWVGVETLARWQHPTRGLLGPGAFVPLLERMGLGHALTEVVFREAMTQAAAWAAAGHTFKVAVNCTMDSLEHAGFVDFVTDTVNRCGVDPSRVILEVTESQLSQDITRPLESLMRLRMKKIGCSIDDFGTGYSSLEQLKRLPFTELKIDRAFVHGAATNESSRAILEASVALARRLKLDIVAEGAETAADWDICATMGCDMVQGYFIARPMGARDMDSWLAE